MKKICFLLVSLGVLNSSAFALNQVNPPANYSNSAIVDMSANPKPPLALTSLPGNFPFGVTGMQDNDFQSIARSKKEGATVQYVVPNKAFVDDETDVSAMTAQLNYMLKVTAQYFKKHPELKGTLMVHMTVYPGYKEPYKYPQPRTTDPKVLEIWPKINAEIAKKTQCNKEGFCQYGMLDHAVFYPQTPDSKASLDLADYANFSMSQPGRKDVPDVFTQSIEHTDRIELWIFMGTNGSLITRQDAENMVRHELSNRIK